MPQPGKTCAPHTLYLSTRQDRQHGMNGCRELSGFLVQTRPTHSKQLFKLEFAKKNLRLYKTKSVQNRIAPQLCRCILCK